MSVDVPGRGLTQQRCAPQSGAGSRHVARGPALRRVGPRSYEVIIGVDPHKRTHTASALEPGSHRMLAALQVDATLAGYRQLARWAARFEGRRWAVETARGLGRHLAQWLAARGERVENIPCAATARARKLSCGGRRKNDVIAVAAAASVAALAGDATPILVEDLSTVLALLDERRANLAAHRTRLVNQLHALLRDLISGGADTELTATGAARPPRPPPSPPSRGTGGLGPPRPIRACRVRRAAARDLPTSGGRRARRQRPLAHDRQPVRCRAGGPPLSQRGDVRVGRAADDLTRFRRATATLFNASSVRRCGVAWGRS